MQQRRVSHHGVSEVLGDAVRQVEQLPFSGKQHQEARHRLHQLRQLVKRQKRSPLLLATSRSSFWEERNQTAVEKEARLGRMPQ